MTTTAPDTLTLWKHIYSGAVDPSAGQVYVGLFAGRRDAIGDKDFAETEQAYFIYPDEAPKADRWLHKRSAAGWDVYFCAHLLTAMRRRKEHAAHVIALWTEQDADSPIPEHLTPTTANFSSPGRKHVYMRLTRAIAPEKAEELNKRWGIAISADPSGYDLTQLLRPIGALNYKYEGTPKVASAWLHGEWAYDPDELDRLLPPLPEKPVRVRGAGCARPAGDLGSMTDRYERRRYNLETSLGGKWARVLAGDYSAFAGRSEAVMGLVDAMVARHFTDAEIEATLIGSVVWESRTEDKGVRHVDNLLPKEIARARAYVELFRDDPGAPPAVIDMREWTDHRGADDARTDADVTFQDDTRDGSEDAGSMSEATAHGTAPAGCRCTCCDHGGDEAGLLAEVRYWRNEARRAREAERQVRDVQTAMVRALANPNIGAQDRITAVRALPSVYSRTASAPTADGTTAEGMLAPLYVGNPAKPGDDGIAAAAGASRRTALKGVTRIGEIGAIQCEVKNIDKPKPGGGVTTFTSVKAAPVYPTLIDALQHIATWTPGEGEQPKNGHGGARRKLPPCPDCGYSEAVAETTTLACLGCGQALGKKQIKIIQPHPDDAGVTFQDGNRDDPIVRADDEDDADEPFPVSRRDLSPSGADAASEGDADDEPDDADVDLEPTRARILTAAERQGWRGVAYEYDTSGRPKSFYGGGRLLWQQFTERSDPGRLREALALLDSGARGSAT